MEKKVGFVPGEVDRVTFALTFPDGVGREPAPLFLITTTKPYSREKVLKAHGPDIVEEKHKGKSYYVQSRVLGDPGAVAFINDRLLIEAPVTAMRLVLDREPGMDHKGRMGEAIRRMAAGKHHYFVAVNPSSFIKEIEKELPPQAEPFKPLLRMEFATQTWNFGKDIRGEVVLNFTKADQAKAAEKSLHAALGMVKPLLAEGIKEIAANFKEDAELVHLGKALQKALDTVKVQQAGADLRVNLSMELDVGRLTIALAKAVSRVREAANRMTSSNNLKHIGLAMLNYESTYNQFPAHAIYSKDGKPLLSWRVEILPYLEADPSYGDLFREFKLDEGWDSPHNKKLLARMPRVYAPAGRETKEPHTTFYQVFTGKDTMFEGPNKMRLARIRDGSSNTLMVVEAGEPVPWTKPQDLVYDPKRPLPKLGGVFPGLPTFNAAFGDGSVRAISKNIKEDVLRALITARGGEVINPDDLDK
jgi:Protein of unknown function (DUF1559)